MTRVALTGNGAVALALKQVEPDVMAAYPITPQTEIAQNYAQYVADGAVKTEYIAVESEHSAMSSAIGAAAAGARTVTATSSQGFALMWEMLYIAASLRLPITMPVITRALSGPINIHCDHSDSMGGRDSGWIQLYGEDAQEGYDNAIQAFRIAEHMDVRLPVMTMIDGFIISGAIGPLETVADEDVKNFVGEYQALNPLLNVEQPVTVGAFDSLGGWYFEHKVAQNRAMENAMGVIEEVGAEYGVLTGRDYAHFKTHEIEDAEVVLIAIGSAAGNVKSVVDQLRANGKKVGMMKVRTLRPFPYLQIAEALSGARAIGVMDRADSFGAQGGPLYLEVRSAMLEAQSRPQIFNFIYGLGGRDIFPNDIESAVETLERAAAGEKVSPTRHYLNVREG
ncbi:MAG: pyruvate ferredoxin oxidoreductase [Thermoleophilia bacterium]|nr:pyruvate ferredoxin oxidoreductase [Thermoleophilia bacterium]